MAGNVHVASMPVIVAWTGLRDMEQLISGRHGSVNGSSCRGSINLMTKDVNCNLYIMQV